MRENEEFPAVNEVLYRLNGTMMRLVNPKNKDDLPPIESLVLAIEANTQAMLKLAKVQLMALQKES